MCSDYAAEVVAGSAILTGIVIDSEHSPNSLPTIVSQLQAFFPVQT